MGGGRLNGRYSKGHTRWVATTPLSTATTYTVDAVVDAGTDAITQSTNFRTLTPKHSLAAAVAPLTGETVGVGMPIAVYFNAPVLHRAAVERRFHVTSSHQVHGAWHWYSGTEMHYRPKAYWPANSDVTLSYDLRGVSAGAGTWGAQARSIPFHIGPAHISRVNAVTHQMSIYSDGKLLHTYPVSTGRDTLPTSSGIHVVLAKAADQIMDSATIGIPRSSPDGYFEHVPWSVRISNSGEFVHAASWSVASQGHTNVSHGCVNMGPAAAKWFFGITRRGDLVVVTGTSRKLEQGNGYADWNLSWSQWLAGSALHRGH
jgi:lipoprotein-anchoring transpeptidase ErfK/SrfK